MDSEFDRYYINIRTILETDAKTIHEELTILLGPNAPSCRTVARWTSHFLERRENVNGDPRPGRPVSGLTDENSELVRQVINNNSHSTNDETITDVSNYMLSKR